MKSNLKLRPGSPATLVRLIVVASMVAVAGYVSIHARRMNAAGGRRVFTYARGTGPVEVPLREGVRQGVVSVAKGFEARGIHHWEINHRLRVTESCWLAARGAGRPIPIFEEVSATKVDEIAHTSAIQVLVGGRPIGSPASIRPLMEHLRRQREHYRTEASFEREADRARMLGLFDEAVAQLARRAGE